MTTTNALKKMAAARQEAAAWLAGAEAISGLSLREIAQKMERDRDFAIAFWEQFIRGVALPPMSEKDVKTDADGFPYNREPYLFDTEYRAAHHHIASLR